MGVWSRLVAWRRQARATPAAAASGDTASTPGEVGAAGKPKTVDLPVEPFVFECQDCGKVFDARRKRPLCPECDSPQVAQVG